MRLRSLFVAVLMIIFVLFSSCRTKRSDLVQKPLFSLLNQKQTRIDFINQLEYTEKFNTYTYRNYYNGAGVGLGDFNNDGLPDIYFCGNQAENRLYINKGSFVFEDVTQGAGVSCSGSWSTGVSIADVNGDGWLDIYVCKSGKPDTPHRSNELFINNGDLTFSEKADEYGLGNSGLSNHASFFDYDRDGDLDCYLLNNSFQSVTDFDMKPYQRQIPDTLGGNKLYRNDNGHFVDITLEAGIYCSKIGFGLGVTVGDINRDGWPDIYVSNDFFERDYLYINNKNGTFTESLEDQIREISAGAMGADIADINNDTWPEIFATEMTPEGNARLKTKALFESWEAYSKKVTSGYYHQFARNVLQLNNRNGSFSEIGRLSGVSATDWSWGALIMDLDNDGWKDIFIANGIYKDLLDLDYLNIYSNPSIMRSMIKTEESAILSLIDMMPSVKIPNYAFHNNADLTFTNLSEKWGLSTPSFSNGAAYGDLDNDGDLDLVVNNVNMPSFVYKNETETSIRTNYLSIKLKGAGKNKDAIGASVILYIDGKTNYSELIPARGFQSSVDNRLHFGLGECNFVDSLIVNWPDGRYSVLHNIGVNQFLTIDENDKSEECSHIHGYVNPTLFLKVEKINDLNYIHSENDFNDFERDRLLFQMLSNEGPHIAVGDVNSDGLDDIYICGAKDSQGALFVQDGQGRFKKTNETLFASDRISEDTDCAFFDADGDGDKDLYVASGGNEFPESSSALVDRLYFNDGKGRFVKSGQILPAGKYESTSCVQPADFDGDGDIDMFVGIRLRPFGYGLPANGYLLENDGHGNFLNETGKLAPGLTGIGMITDMTWADVDSDGDLDIVIVGDWMPVKIFINDHGIFTDQSEKFGLSNTEGWWHTIVAKDLNRDGNVDLILGNHGLNSRFKASEKKPVTMFINDFDLNGTIEQIICTYNGDKSYPLAMKDDLVKQIPSLKQKFMKFDDYKEATIEDIFPDEVLKRSIKLNARIMESCLMINTGKGSFQLTPLPVEAQFSPVYAIAAEDFDNDGNCDILIGGNQYRGKPETGIYDASYGLFLKGNSGGTWQSVSSLTSGFFTKGEIRDLEIMNINGSPIIVVAKNNDNLQFYKY
ncbi:MAG: VCBS repeat-containing protein [Bacteroidia bacterium]|nr:VCBS repeat-containing protein [Bacteroidia bacterium]